jgi:hypothetical protein
MTITEALTAIYLKAVGKATPPTAATSKYTRIIGLMDFYQRRWAREPEVDWNSLYDPTLSLGAVTATDTYDLDSSTVRKLSDREGDAVRIMWTDGVGYTDYDIVDADKLKDYYYGQNKENPRGFYCAQVGKQLVFNHKFVSTDAQFGGDIQVPCYGFPDAITSDDPNSDEVQVDDPDWLVTRVAAEYVRNDITRRQRYPELLTEANEIMTRMIDDNGSQINVTERPWTTPGGIGQESAWS